MIVRLDDDRDHVQVLLLLGVQRQDVVDVFDQSNTLASGLYSELLVFFIAEDREFLFRRDDGTVRFLFMQMEFCFQTKDTFQCLVDPFLRQDAVPDAFLHGLKVFFQITGEEEDVGAAGDGSGHGDVARQHVGKAGHAGRVCDQKAVEAHFLAQQLDVQFFGKAGGQDILIFGLGAEVLRIGRLGDMDRHDGLHTIVP